MTRHEDLVRRLRPCLASNRRRAAIWCLDHLNRILISEPHIDKIAGVINLDRQPSWRHCWVQRQREMQSEQLSIELEPVIGRSAGLLRFVADPHGREEIVLAQRYNLLASRCRQLS